MVVIFSGRHATYGKLQIIYWQKSIGQNIGVQSVSWCSGFLRIYTVAFDRLFKVRKGQLMVKDCPAGLELPAGSRNRRKATVKMRTNPLCHETDFTQILFFACNIPVFGNVINFTIINHVLVKIIKIFFYIQCRSIRPEWRALMINSCMLESSNSFQSFSMFPVLIKVSKFL